MQGEEAAKEKRGAGQGRGCLSTSGTRSEFKNRRLERGGKKSILETTGSLHWIRRAPGLQVGKRASDKGDPWSSEKVKRPFEPGVGGRGGWNGGIRVTNREGN